LFGVLFLLGAAGSYAGYVRTREAVAAYEPPRMFQPGAPKPKPTAAASPKIIPIPDWEGKERINILVLGIDQREDEQGPWRTDTMMLVSVDPVAQSASMLSIPRDVWVTIPGYREDRINNAHFYGDAFDYPGGGPALAKKTVQSFIGVPVDHYVRVNFTAFEKLVDLIGGVDIDVPKEIDDPEYPSRTGSGYDPLHIPAGKQHMDGALALKYARFRHDDAGDFGRAQRQQQVLLAVRDQVLRANKLYELIPKAPEIVAMLESAVQTDFSLDEMIRLAKLGTQLKPENITGEVIDENMVLFATTPDGQQILIPLRDEIRKLREELYVSSAPGAPAPERQAARIVVLNGSPRAGLALQTANALTNQGFRVVRYGNAEHFDYAQTLIVDYVGGPVAQQLAFALGVPTSTVQINTGAHGEYDIQLILGADYAGRFEPSLAPTAPPQ
jgi:LCP family protein required for cell wall assembly